MWRCSETVTLCDGWGLAGRFAGVTAVMMQSSSSSVSFSLVWYAAVAAFKSSWNFRY